MTSSEASIVRHAPHLDIPQAEALARELYGLKATAAPLPSERDANFRLDLADGTVRILKIANALEAESSLDFQNQAMAHLARAGLSDICPQALPDLSGGLIATTTLNGQNHFVRLVTWLEGQPLSQASPHSADLMAGLGRALGRMDKALADFDHPALHRDFHWDLARVEPVLEAALSNGLALQTPSLVQDLLERYRTFVKPALPDLPEQAIHSDANDNNIVVSPQGRWDLAVSGVFDFGDMVFSKRVYEAAIACAYAALDKPDPLPLMAAVISGYQAENPLTEAELELIFDLARLRLAASVCHSTTQFAAAPDNEYLLISQKPAWAALETLAAIPPALATAFFRQSCGLIASPKAERITAWLKSKTGSFAPLMDYQPDFSDVGCLDLSVSSPLVSAHQSQEDLTEDIFHGLAKAGKKIGLGRYDEARLVYTTPLFAVPSNELPESRTIHIGLDFFAPSGSPVYAPLDGKVYSLADNAAPLDYGPTIILEHTTDQGEIFHTLYGHLDPECLTNLTPGQAVKAGQRLAYIGTADINGGWPPHTHLQIITDIFGRTGEYPGVARPSQRQLWLDLCPDPNIIVNAPAELFPSTGLPAEELFAIRRQNLGFNLSLSYDRPLKIVRGQGQYLISDQGQVYLDGVNNVCHVGHCHPRVVAAGQAQMSVLNTNTRYLHDNIINFARELLATFPDPLNVVYFVCTGSEANELAMRLARTYTNRWDLLTLEGAYHGNTQGNIDISPYKNAGPGGKGAPPWVHNMPIPDPYRGLYKGYSEQTSLQYVQHVKDKMAQLEAEGRPGAAFICESMLGCGGQVVMPDRYMHFASQAMHAAGGLLIADEVQVGFGRAGSRFWAFETQEVIPDIVTLGKPIGNGHPLAAVVTTKEIAQAFDNGMEYFNTFGGNPVSCAIGRAVLQVIKEEELQANANAIGQRLLQGLEELKAKHELIGDVRGLGLYIGAELVKDRQTLEPAAEEASRICNRLKEHGILMSTDGPLHNVLKLKPPLVINAQDADRLLELLDKVMSETRLKKIV